jgi:predicted kinase
MENHLTAYVMVGAPGAGKSTYAHKLAETANAVIISGDSIRAELYGDESNQGQWSEIQDRIEEMVSEAVGCPLVMDGTHYRRDYRRQALTLLQSYGYENVEAVVVNPDLETCILRNATRHRHVPRHVIQRMHDALQSSLRGIEDEGFTQVTYI